MHAARAPMEVQVLGVKQWIWPFPASPWLVARLVVLTVLLLLVVAAWSGLRILACCEDPWFGHFLTVAVPALGGAVALGFFLVQRAFDAKQAPAEAPPPAPANRLDQYLARQRDEAREPRIRGIFRAAGIGGRGLDDVTLPRIFVPMDVAAVDHDEVNDPRARTLEHSLLRRDTATPLLDVLANEIAAAEAPAT
jgi:hypothetical protein